MTLPSLKEVSRKWQLTVLFSLADIVALFADKISGAEYISAQIVIITAYSGANVATKHIMTKTKAQTDADNNIS